MRALVLALVLVACGGKRDEAMPVVGTELVTLDAGVAAIDAPPPPPVAHTGIEAHVTAGGAPVANAEVHLSDGSSPTSAIAMTDAAGVARFERLPPGPYELWARLDRQVTPVARLIRDDGDAIVSATLALVAGGAVHGKITADGGVPAGATLRLEPVGLDHATREVTPDARGTFAIDGVPRGTWRLVADAPGYFRDADDALTVGAELVTVDVAMRRGGVVTGVVVDEDGAPVVHATLVVRAQGATPGARAAAPPIAKLRWVHPLAGPRQLPRFDMSHFGAARAGYRPAECGRGHCGADLGGKKGTPVHASADGEVTKVVRTIHPEAGRYVVVEHAGGVRTHYLHLDEIRDDLRVGLRVRAGDPLGTVGATGAAAGPHLHFALSQERDGRSYYLDPEPMLRQAVVLAAPRGLDWAVAEAGAPAPVAGVTPAETALTTDARGAFRVDGLYPGDYVVAAFHPSLAPGVSGVVAIRAAAETGGVTITLLPGVELRGRVLARGVPVAGARVVADEADGEASHRVATAYTNGDGEYVMHAVSGAIVLGASAPGRGSAERAIELGQGGKGAQRREDLELIVEDGKLFGDVRDAAGLGVGGVTVKIVDGPTTRRRTVTDPTGSFLIAGVAPGDYELELSSADYPATRVSLTTDRAKPITLARGATVRVDLRDAHTGDGLAQVQLDAHGPGDRELHPVTDAGGIAVVRGLTPGTWRFRVRAPGYTGLERTLEVDGDADLRLDLARGAVVAGIVRDSYGRRVSGARVWVGDAETVTDGDGNFRIADAPTGSVELQVALGDATATRALELRPGDEQLSLTIDLP